MASESSFSFDRVDLRTNRVAPDRQLVLFWFWGRGRGIASGDWADFYLVSDSLRLNRSDDALIRINTPLQAEEEPEAGQRRFLPLPSE